MDAPDNVTIIRNRTTDDVTELPTAKIDEFLAQYEGNVDLASAEALEYMARQDRYNSVTRGNITESGPTLMARAATYRTRGTNLVEHVKREDAIQMGTMSRADLESGAQPPEYGS